MSTEDKATPAENKPEFVPLGEPLPLGVEGFLRITNRWWQGEPMPPPPPFRRWMFEPTLRRFKNGLTPAVVLRGTRQVGKTTLQEQIIHHLLYTDGVPPNCILRVQFDQMPFIESVQVPVLALPIWFERNVLGDTFNGCAIKGQPVYLLFDEVQNIADWAVQIKVLVDHNTVRVLLTGSSAFKIERGKDSLAGRISTMNMNTLLLREIVALRGWGDIPALLPFNGVRALKEQSFWKKLREHGKRHRKLRDKAFAAFSERGGYPVPQIGFEQPWEEANEHLNETIIQRVIQHDLGVRDPPLLEQLFRLVCRHAGQAPGKALLVSELQSALSRQACPDAESAKEGSISWEDVLTQLELLSSTLLIRLIPPLFRGGKMSKICLSDHSLRASWLDEHVPLTPEGLKKSPHLGHLAGYLAESIVGYFLSTIRLLDVAWFPARKNEPEVDFVITIGQVRIPIEVKYRRSINEHKDAANLRAFLDKKVYNASFGLLITLTDDVTIKDKRIVALPLSSFLLMR